MPKAIMLKEIRESKGLTQKQLGEMCGLAYTAVRNYENGRGNPKMETLEKIAEALNVSTDELINDSTNSTVTEKDCMKALWTLYKGGFVKLKIGEGI